MGTMKYKTTYNIPKSYIALIRTLGPYMLIPGNRREKKNMITNIKSKLNKYAPQKMSVVVPVKQRK